METLREYIWDFDGVDVMVVGSNIEVFDTWRDIEIVVYGSREEFYDCVYNDVCRYLSSD